MAHGGPGYLRPNQENVGTTEGGGESYGVAARRRRRWQEALRGRSTVFAEDDTEWLGEGLGVVDGASGGRWGGR